MWLSLTVSAIFYSRLFSHLTDFSLFSLIGARLPTIIQNQVPIRRRRFLCAGKYCFKRFNCYDLEGFLQVTHAATLNDTFWVRLAKSHLSWNNVSLFQNPFDDVVARIAFEGGLYGEHFSTASPEFSTDGTFAKCWTRLDNQIFLMKRGSEGGANLSGFNPLIKPPSNAIQEQATS